jgi:monoterpene epsilon-lactone hydrolase
MPSWTALGIKWSVLPLVRSRMAAILTASPAPLRELRTLRSLGDSFVARSPTHRAAEATVVERSPAGSELHSLASASGACSTLVFAVHGGAFVAGNAALYRPLWSALAKQCGPSVCVAAPSTLLAPEASLDAILEHLEASYVAAVARAGVGADNVVVLGDSAGAHLAVGMLLRLNRSRANATATAALRPRALLLSSPVVSFTKRWADAASRADDPLLPFENNSLQALGSFVLTGNNVFHPQSAASAAERAGVVAALEQNATLSPLLTPAAELVAALPRRVYVTAGSTEGLLPQSEAFAAALQTRVHVRDGLWHSYAAMAGHVPEADDELTRWAAFIREESPPKR